MFYTVTVKWASTDAQTEEIAKKIDSKERALLLAETAIGYKDIVEGAEQMIAHSPSGAATTIFKTDKDAQEYAEFFKEFGDIVQVSVNSVETLEKLKEFVESK